MPVGHVRINDPNPNPNDNITFIRVLEDLPDSDLALKILTALAAQFKPIMKEWGFGVNSLVEYEWNPTFAGRNWNAGEVVEIVLRRRDGTFAPYQFLLYVMCHELAHIREMNHSWAFQKVNSQIRSTLARLRAQGYFGDGFWSGGRSLKYPNAALPAAEADLATMTCGGANKKSRGTRRRRIVAANQGEQRERGSAVKLGQTGRQTAIPRKAGGRVSKKNAFAGEGKVLSEDPAQSTFKRRAQAHKAIEARAAAAEARIAAEKRARAAEARVKAEAGPSRPAKVDKKAKPDINLVSSESEPEPDTEEDEPDDVHDVGGGWETDDEDKPAIILNDEERRWLASDMHNWETTFADEGEDVKPEVGPSKGKGRSTPNDAPPSTSKTKRKASPPVKARPSIEIDDLTPEERAWLEEDMAGGDKGVEEASGAGGKKARVAYMPMPAWMGGEPSGEYVEDSCDDDPDPDRSPRSASASDRLAQERKVRRSPELTMDQPLPPTKGGSAPRDKQVQARKPCAPKNLLPPLAARAPPTLPVARREGASRGQSATSASSPPTAKPAAKSTKTPSLLQQQKAASKAARKARARQLLDDIAADEARNKPAKTKSSSLKDLAASLRTKPSVTARAMKHAGKQRSTKHAVIVGLELRSEKPQAPEVARSDHTIALDDSDNASSSASSVCSIPAKLDNSMSTDELTKILASLDKQAAFNANLAAKRARKLATLRARDSPRIEQDVDTRDSRTGGQPSLSPGPKVNKRDDARTSVASKSPAQMASESPAKSPTKPSKSPAKSASKSPQKAGGKAQQTQGPKLDTTSQVYNAALAKQKEQKALIEEMEARGMKWQCRICEFQNDPHRASCRACFLGTIAGSTAWVKPAKVSQQDSADEEDSA